MNELWKDIVDFRDYSVSDWGNIKSKKTGRLLIVYATISGLAQVGMMRDGTQCHRSVPLLVARAFIIQPRPAFDTPINLDGDRFNNRVDNLCWRPRWFAVKYHLQFQRPYPYRIKYPIEDMDSGEITSNSLECAKRYGLLEEDLVDSIISRTYTWPTNQRFRVVER